MANAPAQQGVSVIVPTYNRRDFLPAAVASLIQQTVPPLEIIVVNDGSDYDVRALLENQGPLVTVVDTVNQGKPAAVNRGVEQAKGNYIWVFDDDDIAETSYIERCLPHLADPDVDYVFGWHFAGDSLSAGEVEKTEERRPRLETDKDIFAALLSGCSIAHNAIIARKACYLELGGMDVSFPCSEDYEFQLRLARRYKGRYVDVPAFIRRVHGGDRGGSGFRYRASERRQRFLKQDRRFIGSYLQELPLADYWLETFGRIENDEVRTRAQYLYKFQVAAGVGLWDLAVKTLEEAAADPACASVSLEDQEVRQVSAIYAYAEPEVLDRFDAKVHAAAISRLGRTASSTFLRQLEQIMMQGLAKRFLLCGRQARLRDSVVSASLLFRIMLASRFR